jgi:polyisoprenoid-binding protein YceI
MRIAALLTCLIVASGARAAPTTQGLEVGRSDLVVTVRKKGLFSAFEHDHFLHPQRWHGTLTFDPEHPDAARVELVLDAASLVDQQPKLKPADRQKVEEQIRSPMVLDAAQFPEVRFTGDRLEVKSRQNGPRAGEQELSGVLTGTLELHGHKKPLALPFHARYNAGGVGVKGHVELNQSDFGIRPLSKAGGAIAVHDRVEVDFDAVFAVRR